MRRGWRITLSDILFLGVFASSLISGRQALSIDSDLGRHIVIGNYILDHRLVPTHDLFSHTLAGQSRPPYEWLSQVVFALANRLLRLDGVILLTTTLIGITFALVYRQAYQRSKSPLLSLLITLIAAAASSLHWLPRPHIVTFLLLAIWVDKLEQVRKGEEIKIFIFPLSALLWANLHGGFIFGFLALAAYGAGWFWEIWRKQTTNEIGKNFLLIGLTSLPASVITPDLWRNWEAVLNNHSAFILSRTAETMPPNFSDPFTTPFAILFALAGFFIVVNRRAVPAAHIFLLGGLGGMSLLMARNIPLFSIACAPLLAGWISTTMHRVETWKKLDQRFDNLSTAKRFFLLPLIVTLTAAFFLANNHAKGKEIFQFNPQVFPVQAADWLEQNPQDGAMFNDFNWGGYLLYRLSPRELVFVDSQSDFYGEALLREYETITLARNDWNGLLERYEINWAIIPVNSPLATQLKNESGWVIVYQDDTAVIFNRK
ncbi:MAG: hypothetical protein IT314_03045 [Anaerolineales bacterium]|nr:hypothetical protein [Anaerolineales bacterium]